MTPMRLVHDERVPLFSFEGRSPAISPSAWIAPTATLVGDREQRVAGPGHEVGEGATVGHLCVVHGAVIGAEALIGNGATILDGVTVGKRALVAAGCTVPPGMVIPDDMLAVGVPARIAGEVAGGARRWVQTNPQVYRDLARRHAAGARIVSE